MKFRLQVSVATIFAVSTAVVLGVAVGLFYAGNRRLASDTAARAMAQARVASEAALAGTVAPVGRAVATAAALVAAVPEAAADGRALAVMDAAVRDLPQIDSLFVGHARDGALDQVVRVPADAATFGAAEVPVPPGAARILRRVTVGEDGRTDRLTFLDGDGRPLAVATHRSDYDARARPWFALAEGAAGPVVSPVYVFAGTGRPGVTLSLRIAEGGGQAVAVAGADMSLDAIAAVLRTIRADGVGELFLLDAEGALIAASEGAGDRRDGPLTVAAMRAFDAAGGDAARFVLPETGRAYLATRAPTLPLFGQTPILGVIVPEDHHTGAIAATTWRVLQLSGLVLLVGLAGTLALSRLVGASLVRVADEARRISAFDLRGDFALTSRIIEVEDLGMAVGRMKNSLASFAAYVPRDVVRGIVAAGGRAAVGGAVRPVTLMFSDIEDFTRRSERLPPEVLTADLSRYFEAMDAAIAAHGGTIDKYIGDAVMALWNAPQDDPDHAAHACRAALACRAAGLALAGTGAATLFPVRTRIGLHTDRVVVGNVGSARRLQYTAIGGAVNLASRVEGLNKLYGTGILATGAVVEAAGAGFLFCPVDLVVPAGTSRPVALHALLGETAPDAAHPPPPGAAAAVAAWADALALYRARDWAGAARAVAAADEGGSAVPAALRALYRDRCARMAADPPPPDWTGAHNLDRK